MVLGRIFKQCFLLGLASTEVQKGKSGGAQEKDTEKAAWLQAEMVMGSLGREALALPAAQHPQKHKANGAGVSTAMILRLGILV